MSGFDSRVLAVAQKVGHSLGIAIDTVMEKPARAARVAAVLEEIEHQARIAGARSVVARFTEDRPDPELISPTTIALAIAAGHMRLYLQPVVSTADGLVASAEGLIRWHHPAAGVIPPDRFLPIAEQDGATIDQMLTRWVMQTT